MKNISNFNDFINESSINAEEEAQAILDDILAEREPDEVQTMSMEDAMETVEAYGHEGKLAKKIAKILHSLAEGI